MRVTTNSVLLCGLAWFFAVFPVAMRAGTLHVNCDGNKGLTRIQKAIDTLQKAGSPGPNEIVVSGSCKENISIQSMDNLTLTAKNGASISDASHGNADMIDIFDSRRILISGFIINGGASGLSCTGYSLCRTSGNTIQGSAGFGVWAINSQVKMSGDTVQNHAARGINIIGGSQVNADSIVVQGNGDGIVLNTQGVLSLSNSAVQGNSNRGIFALNGSTIRLLASTVTGNTSDGVLLNQSSQARFESFAGANNIANNGGAGVNLGDLSFADFEASSNVTGNAGGVDVVCNPQYSATRGALTNISGGTTNCVEP